MNPRILKKLSKKAAPLVARLTQLERFETCSGEDIDCNQRMDRKHWERFRGRVNDRGYFIAKKNTVGFGCMSGYEEPEWEELDAYSHLKNLVAVHFTDWGQCDGESYPQCSVPLNTPSDVFKFAAHL